MKKSIIGLIYISILCLFLSACIPADPNQEFPADPLRVTFVVDYVEDYYDYATKEMEVGNLVLPEEPQIEGYVFDGWYWDYGTWEKPLTVESLIEEQYNSELRVYAKLTRSWLSYISTLSHTDQGGYELSISAKKPNTELDSYLVCLFDDYHNLPQNYNLNIEDGIDESFVLQPNFFDNVDTLRIGENISAINGESFYGNATTIYLGKDLKKIEKRACYGFEPSGSDISFIFEGDCPVVEDGAFNFKNKIEYYITSYYFHSATGFSGKFLDRSILKEIGAEVPALPDMTIKEYALSAAIEGRELAHEIFDSAKNAEMIDYYMMPACNPVDFCEIKDFTLELTKGTGSETEAAKRIFDWIVSNVSYSGEAMFFDSYQAFKQRIAVCCSYTLLMHDMLAAIGIPSAYTSGISYFGTPAEWGLEQFLKDVRTITMVYDHAWITFLADNKIIVADPTWNMFDMSDEEIAEGHFTYDVDGIAVVPDDIDLSYYGMILYRNDDGYIYMLSDGKMYGTDGYSSCRNFAYTMDFNFHCANDGMIYDGIQPSGSAYNNGLNYYYLFEQNGEYDWEFALSTGRTLKYRDVLAFSLLESEIYDHEIELPRKERFILSDSLIYKILNDNEVEAFYYIGNSETVSVPAYIGGRKVKRIGNYCFDDCDTIVTLTLADSIEELGIDAVYGNDNLKTIYLGKELKIIGAGCFQNCPVLEYVVIPASIEEIGCVYEPFELSNSLEYIFYGGTLEQFEAINFNDEEMQGQKEIYREFYLNHIAFYSNEAPTNKEYKYWHYENGEPTLW